MISASRKIDHSPSARPAPLDVLRERAEAKAVLIANGYLDLQSAVDELWEAAERAGLVKTLGADEVQRILSESFGRWRLANE
jgi:hypothetical protein